MLSYEGRGKEMMEEFKLRVRVIQSDGRQFYNPIMKYKWKVFSCSTVKSTVKERFRVLLGKWIL